MLTRYYENQHIFLKEKRICEADSFLILKRQVKRPACTKTDRILLVLLARAVRAWKQTLLIIQPETRLTLASGALPPVLEAQVKGLDLKSRKVIHVGVTRSPTGPWVAQHLREATPYGQAPKYLI